MDWDTVTIVIIIILVLFMSLLTFDMLINQQIAMGNAHIKCQDLNYDFADEIARPFWSQESVGTKCGIINYEQRQIKMVTEDGIPVIIG